MLVPTRPSSPSLESAPAPQLIAALPGFSSANWAGAAETESAVESARSESALGRSIADRRVGRGGAAGRGGGRWRTRRVTEAKDELGERERAKCRRVDGNGAEQDRARVSGPTSDCVICRRSNRTFKSRSTKSRKTLQPLHVRKKAKPGRRGGSIRRSDGSP